jgi:hypothetical protein
MKSKLFLMAVLLNVSVAAISCGSSETKKDNKTTTPTEAVVYTCPMHPEITSDKPGSCPKCGMDLQEAKK